ISSWILPGESDTIGIYVVNDSIESCGILDIETSFFLASVYYCGEDTCLVDNEVADTVISTHLEIQKPDIHISNFSVSGDACSGDSVHITFDIENMSTVMADSVYVVISCGNNGFVYDSILYAPFYAEDSISVEINLDTICYDCDSIYLQLVSSCNCDTIITDTLPLPLNVSFMLADSCFAVGVPIPFINLSNPESADWLWDFGNGDVSTNYNPIYAFAEPNYNGDSCEFSMLIEVFPDICACNWSLYDSIDIVVDEDMTISSDISVYGTITVEPGNTLTIADDRIIRFGPAGQIIVKGNAVLHLGRYVVLTSLEEPGCDYMWKGIEVWGSGLLPSNNPAQGIVEHGTKAGMKIKNAHIGILAGKRNMSYLTGESPSLWDFSKSGGVLKFVDNSLSMTFENCGIGIKYIKKKNGENTQNCVNACVFKTEGILIDPHYLKTNAFKYPNIFNPFNGNANFSQRTDLGLSVWGIWGNQVKGDRFNNVEFGLDSKDARFDVVSNETGVNSDFYNCKFGIFISNSVPSALFKHNIENCYFDHIYDPTVSIGTEAKSLTAAIYVNNGRYDFIKNNIFSYNDISNSQDYNYCGIYTTNSSSFNIIENIFYYWQYGIITINTSKGGGNIISGIEGLGNRFTFCKKSLVTSLDNFGLKTRCNVCINDVITGSIPYIVNWDNFGLLGNQGSMPPFATAPDGTPWIYADRYPVGHRFSPAERKQIKSWNSEYNYFRHRDVFPDYYSQLVPDIDDSPEEIFVHNTNVPWGLNSCKPVLVNIEPAQLITILTSLVNYSGELNEELITARSNLDNGKTQELIDAINGNTPSGRLKDLLINNSPLSDEVILSLFEEYPLSHGNFKNVMEKNLPVSDDIQSEFFNLIENIPQGIANQLKQLQVDNPTIVTPSILIREIDKIENLIQLIRMELIDRAINDGDVQTAIDIIEVESGFSFYKQLLASIYYSKGEYSNANSWLTELSSDPAYSEWVDLMQTIVDIENTGQSIYALNESQIQNLFYLSDEQPTQVSAASANGILYQLFGYVPEFSIPEEVTGRSMEISSYGNESSNVEKIETAFIGDNYPNPFDNITNIPYYLPKDDKGTIKVFNTDGEFVCEYLLKPGRNELKIETKNWQSGVYIYSFETNSGIKERRKMVLIKQ
ncbi:MAG: Peptidase S8 and S53 subtilisin kexin sedolisin, partial [candidate division TM6 bacterium GW2011_GWF2_33_332]